MKWVPPISKLSDHEIHKRLIRAGNIALKRYCTLQPVAIITIQKIQK